MYLCRFFLAETVPRLVLVKILNKFAIIWIKIYFINFYFLNKDIGTYFGLILYFLYFSPKQGGFFSIEKDKLFLKFLLKGFIPHDIRITYANLHSNQRGT